MPLGRNERNPGIENTFDAGQLLVNHVGGAVCGAAHRAAGRRHLITDQLLARKHVEQPELHLVGVVAGLHDLADDHRLDPQDRPVVKIDIHRRSRLLQHVVLRDRRKPAAAHQICADHVVYLGRHAGGAALPTERHDRNRRAAAEAFGDLDTKLGAGAGGQQDEQKQDF